MKAITIWQPWAHLIVSGKKCYETRSWSTRHRGFLAIHASKRWTKAEREYVAHFKDRFPSLRMSLADELPLGCIVAAVDVVAVHRVEDIRDTLSQEERAFGNYDNGRYAWELKVVKLPDAPIPAKGQQGLWEWTNE